MGRGLGLGLGMGMGGGSKGKGGKGGFSSKGGKGKGKDGKGKGKGKGKDGGKGKGKGKDGGKGKGKGGKDGGKGKGVRAVRTSTTEPEVGISQFMNEAHGFLGVLKLRYTDFIVNELGVDGEVVRLQKYAKEATKKRAHEWDDSGRSKVLANEWGRYLSGAMTDANKRSRVVYAPNALEQSPAVASWGAYLTGTDIGTEEDHPLLRPGVEAMRALTSDAVAEDLFAFLKDADLSGTFVLPPVTDKVVRKAMHGVFKDHLSELTLCDTIDDPAGTPAKCVRVQKRGSKTLKSDGFFDPRSSQEAWPQDRPQYLKFTMHKENQDTIAAVGAISKRLGIKDRNFTYAGTKDKRAVTSQFVTLWKTTEEKLARVNNARLNIWVGDCSYVDEPLRLGHLAGNRFGIVLRYLRLAVDGVKHEDTAAAAAADGAGNASGESDAAVRAGVGAAAEQWAAGGFVNYFGLQRFGSGSVPTHHVGRLLLKHDWEGAGRAILKPEPSGGYDDVAKARDFAAKGDFRNALYYIPPWCTAEKAVLMGLEKHGETAWLNGISGIPFGLRQMYVHAYQSFVWNHVASARIAIDGAAAIAGDLVFDDSAEALAAAQAKAVAKEAKAGGAAAKAAKAEPAVKMETETEAAAAVDAEGDGTLGGRYDGEKGDEIDHLPAVRRPVKVLSAADVASGQYTVFDVLLPTPGYDIQWPSHAAFAKYVT